MASNLYWLTIGFLFLSGIWATVMFYQYPSWALAMLLPLLVWLMFDPVVFAFGNILGEGATLQVLHSLRYFLRAIATPFFLVIAFDQAKRARVKRMDDPLLPLINGILILALIVVGIVRGFLGFNLDPVELEGIKQYQPDTPPGLPLAALATIVLVALLGVGIYRATRTPWLMIGGLALLLGTLAPAAISTLPASLFAFASPFFVLCVLLVEKKLQQISPNPAIR